MNFLDYPVYVMGCMGIGDIICSLNALENIGKERQRKIEVYIVHPHYFQRVFDIYNSLELKFVNIHFSDFETIKKMWENKYTVFQAFGMEVSWVKDWLYGWGLRESIGYENMVKFKSGSSTINNTIGMSFTVVSNPKKNIAKESVIRIIKSKIEAGNQVVYFGFNKDSDQYIRHSYGNDIDYCDYDLRTTIQRIGTCGEFIGADSGMSWLSAFHRIKTSIIVGESFGWLPNTFDNIPWVKIYYEHR